MLIYMWSHAVPMQGIHGGTACRGANLHCLPVHTVYPLLVAENSVSWWILPYT